MGIGEKIALPSFAEQTLAAPVIRWSCIAIALVGIVLAGASTAYADCADAGTDANGDFICHCVEAEWDNAKGDWALDQSGNIICLDDDYCSGELRDEYICTTNRQCEIWLDYWRLSGHLDKGQEVQSECLNMAEQCKGDIGCFDEWNHWQDK